MRINRTPIAALSVVAGIALSQSFAASASAEDYPVAIAFNDPASQTLEYGQYWSFPLTTDYMFPGWIYDTGNATVTTTGAPSGFNPEFAVWADWSTSSGAGYVAAPYDAAPLGVGTYVISVEGSMTDGTDTYSGKTSPPATLVVEKAKLGMELRIVADPANADAAIITAKFTGRFVSEYQSSYFPGAAKSPAGTWHVTITDEAGEVAIERSVERSAGDDILATSFYWTDAEPGVQYTAKAEFAASGASASNFSITSASDFTFTGAEEQRPVPTSTATAKPDAALPQATEFGLPLWSLITVGVLIVGLGALVTVLSVRLSRRSTPSPKEVAA